MRKETAISPELSGGVWLSERKAFSLYGCKVFKGGEDGGKWLVLLLCVWDYFNYHTTRTVYVDNDSVISSSDYGLIQSLGPTES